MRYETPQLIGDSSATIAIQNVGEPLNDKRNPQTPDSTIDPAVFCTSAAYEADE
jgi:hypothetical protein